MNQGSTLIRELKSLGLLKDFIIFCFESYTNTGFYLLSVGCCQRFQGATQANQEDLIRDY